MADALRLALPRGTRVAHGKAGLHRAIAWARAFISRPWSVGALEPESLVLLSTRGLTTRSEIQALTRLGEALLASRVAAIVVGDESPDVVAAVAVDDGLPVLVMPGDVALPNVERAIVGLIVDRDGQIQRRALEIYQLLIQLALEDAPPKAMAESLADAAARVVYVEDEYGILQAVASPVDRESLGLPSLQEAPQLYSAREVLGISTSAPAANSPRLVHRRLSGDGYAVFASPISLGQTVAGFLTLLGPADELHDLDEQIVLRAASAFAVPIAKQRAIVETQTRLQGSFMENLFAGTIADEAEIASRARYLGHNLMEPYDTACLTLDHTDGRSPMVEAQRAALWTSFLDLARRELLERSPRALLRERGDLLAVLLPAGDSPPTDEMKRYFEDARVRLAGLVGRTTATVGIGRRAAGPRDIVRSYGEAEQAARIAREFLGGNRTVTFEELGVYRLIARVEDRDTLDAFRDEHLGALDAYDARHGGELIETLEGFFSCNGNHARAAEVLHLHRNTLLYRLDRIKSLTGRDLSDPETRLSMQLALKIRRVFPTILARQPRSPGGRS